MPHGNCKLSHVSLKLDGLLAYKVQATHTHTHTHIYIYIYEKWYVYNNFTTNSKWQVVTGCYYWVKKVISMLNSNLNQ